MRPATAADVPFLRGLRADPSTAEFLAVTELDDAALMAELTAEDIGRLVATREGQPVAGLRWRLVNRRSRIAELSEVVVDPRVRGQGVGVALVRAACGLLFDRGEHRVQLEVYGDNLGGATGVRASRLPARGDAPAGLPAPRRLAGRPALRPARRRAALTRPRAEASSCGA